MNPENPYEAPKVDKTFDYEKPAVQPTLKWILFAFDGRVPRRIYWGASLSVTFIFYAVVFALVAIFGEESPVATGGILVMYIPLVWISLAIQIKRWHDRDKSGWWVLIGLIPCIGPIWAFVECGCLRGTFGSNTYGPDPT